MVLEMGIFPILIDLMNTAEFEVKKEACWAVKKLKKKIKSKKK